LTLPESQNARRSSIYASVTLLLSGVVPGKKIRNNRHIGHKAYCRPMNAVRRFVADETAATAIEYCLIASGIALGIFVAVAGIEARINAEFTAINSSLK
jgi:pilus assembly protein Flp/PilA